MILLPEVLRKCLHVISSLILAIYIEKFPGSNTHSVAMLPVRNK